ncbi:hypothetical protein Tco_0972549 [Tanacetum coccineum]
MKEKQNTMLMVFQKFPSQTFFHGMDDYCQEICGSHQDRFGESYSEMGLIGSQKLLSQLECPVLVCRYEMQIHKFLRSLLRMGQLAMNNENKKQNSDTLQSPLQALHKPSQSSGSIVRITLPFKAKSNCYSGSCDEVIHSFLATNADDRKLNVSIVHNTGCFEGSASFKVSIGGQINWVRQTTDEENSIYALMAFSLVNMRAILEVIKNFPSGIVTFGEVKVYQWKRFMLEFCGEKGIKQEFSNARTPQQNEELLSNGGFFLHLFLKRLLQEDLLPMASLLPYYAIEEVNRAMLKLFSLVAVHDEEFFSDAKMMMKCLKIRILINQVKVSLKRLLMMMTVNIMIHQSTNEEGTDTVQLQQGTRTASSSCLGKERMDRTYDEVLHLWLVEAIEEVYVSQHPGFVDPVTQEVVYGCFSSLYGLHQDPRALVSMIAMGELLIFFSRLKSEQMHDGIFISEIFMLSVRDFSAKADNSATSTMKLSTIGVERGDADSTLDMEKKMQLSLAIGCNLLYSNDVVVNLLKYNYNCSKWDGISWSATLPLLDRSFNWEGLLLFKLIFNGQTQSSADPTPSLLYLLHSSSHCTNNTNTIIIPPVTIYLPHLLTLINTSSYPTVVKTNTTTPPTQPAQTTSSPPILYPLLEFNQSSTISSKVPSHSYHDTEGQSCEPSLSQCLTTLHEPVIQAI